MVDPTQEAPCSSQVELQGVSHAYRGVEVLRNLSLELRPGVTLVTGPNGAGKSTLGRILASIEAPSSGRLGVTVDGEPVHPSRIQQITGWLPQAFAYPKRMRVNHFVEYAGWLKGLSRRDLSAKVADALDSSDISHIAHKRLGGISGGQLRRAGLAAATVHSPRILILDEPATGLDEQHQLDLEADLKSERFQDRVTVVVTHSPHNLRAYAQVEVRIVNGGIEFCEKPDSSIL